ncbi:hypothetical protein PVAND_006765 [Polypedilum vanderplanki]|uniref:Phosphatidic acid phosphatase type 2/haloperoxidase domain-containing protein n=1 Tax=Polypedilum vanderplanki TaxID=319348 RepID=A0A9J6C4Z8_POLVA|nr:hypothetical protein PVAND_006765 [Polypedilum vanderplanki]
MVNQNGKTVVVKLPMEQSHIDSTETSPLNQRLRDNNSDISSSPSSAVNSDQSSKKLLHNSSTNQSRKILLNIFVDVIVLCLVGSAIVIFFLIGEPYERGFFCNDESLLHPHHTSTVKHWMLFLFGIVVPIVVIFFNEIVRSKKNLDEKSELKLFNWTISACKQNLYKFIGMFLLGTASCQLLTDIGKYSIGRYRPYFITLCQPILSDGTNCSDPKNLYQYITNFTCNNPAVTEKMLKDIRMSFPSANSSFSFFTMTYCALYLNARFEWNGTKILNYFLQFMLIALAWFTSLSRISDYKHHWSDVLAGSTLGFLLAIFVCHFILKLQKREKCSNLKLPSTKYELSTQTQNQI